MSDIYHKHRLSDGRAIWVQRIKVVGIRKPQWSVVECGPELEFCAPTITDVANEAAGIDMITDLLRADVMETN